MGRPRKKRKYTRRQNGGEQHNYSAYAAQEVSRIRREIMEMPKEVASLVVLDLIADLHSLKQFYDKYETAPAP